MTIPEGYDGVNLTMKIYNVAFFNVALTAEQAAEEFRKFTWAWKCAKVLHPHGRGIYPRNTDNML